MRIHHNYSKTVRVWRFWEIATPIHGMSVKNTTTERRLSQNVRKARCAGVLFTDLSSIELNMSCAASPLVRL